MGHALVRAGQLHTLLRLTIRGGHSELPGQARVLGTDIVEGSACGLSDKRRRHYRATLRQGPDLGEPQRRAGLRSQEAGWNGVNNALTPDGKNVEFRPRGGPVPSRLRRSWGLLARRFGIEKEKGCGNPHPFLNWVVQSCETIRS
jgi:hypothetical protein